jgi:hypothetical protein
MAQLLATGSGHAQTTGRERTNGPPPLRCEADQVEAGGRPDPTLFAPDASHDVRARWCERYDGWGRSTRSGPYQEIYPNGALRVRARYLDSELDGTVEIRHENGRPFLAGRLREGEWDGPLALFHENGGPWWVGRFREGRLHGTVRSYFPDGAIESEAHFQSGREDGLARSFYPRTVGGGLKSETRLEADLQVGAHRLFAPGGQLRQSLRGGVPPATRTEMGAPAAPRGATSKSPARPGRRPRD